MGVWCFLVPCKKIGSQKKVVNKFFENIFIRQIFHTHTHILSSLSQSHSQSHSHSHSHHEDFGDVVVSIRKAKTFKNSSTLEAKIYLKQWSARVQGGAKI